MITAKNMLEIFNYIISDEAMCRLLAYGENPLDDDKSNIVDTEGCDTLMKDIIRFSPQIHDIEEHQRARMCLYKSYTKMSLGNSVVRNECIEIDLYVPHELVRKDMRIYLLENKLVGLLDGFKISGFGNMEYVDGQFNPAPNVMGYSYYKMLFTMKQGRTPTIARY